MTLLHETVSGHAVEAVMVAKDDAIYRARFAARGEAVLVPHCNGRERVVVDGVARDARTPGPLVVRLDGEREHAITIEAKASTYEKRLACSHAPIAGVVIASEDGLARMRFESPHRGGGEAVVFVPGGHDRSRPAAVLVGTHPWNGSAWTYAAYEELLARAGRRDVVLLMPSGLGNSLYTADAEDEVMRAIDALGKELAVDPQRVSIWGASMGGAGATTIAFHRPDRFAYVASFFGDSRYDLTTYARGVLGGEEGAHRVNALDVLENARHLPVFLVHGEDDRVSPIRQSTMLDAAMRKAGFDVRFERVPKMGHEGPLILAYVREVVDHAATAIAPSRPKRVSFRSVRPIDTQAYGVRLVRAGAGDAFVDVERRDDGVHVLAAEGVSEIALARDALGGRPDEPIKGAKIRVRWEP